MNASIEAKKSPEVKPWVRRVVEAAGVFMPSSADAERRLGWWGVEMARFLKFCRTLPAETALRPAMEGYGRYLKNSVPPPQDWQLDQAREALRCFQKGTENWHIAAPDAQGRVEVSFRVKTRMDGTLNGLTGSGSKSGCRGRRMGPNRPPPRTRSVARQVPKNLAGKRLGVKDGDPLFLIF